MPSFGVARSQQLCSRHQVFFGCAVAQDPSGAASVCRSGGVAHVNMAAPLAEEVYAGDASTHGWALMYTFASFVESSAACGGHERWRFCEVPIAAGLPPLSGAAMNALGGLAALGGGLSATLPSLVPELGFFAESRIRGNYANSVPAALRTALLARGDALDHSCRTAEPGVNTVSLRHCGCAFGRLPNPSKQLLQARAIVHDH